jgi:LmbE family N-acetylglucosaminyl deacetylase
MKLDFTGERVLAVIAHPDDAELLCAGTLARARADGATIGICTICRGDKGVAANGNAAGLAQVRQAEFKAAVDLLGAEVFFGEIDDGELADTPAHRGTLISIYRQYRPTLVLAHCPNDYHADHRAASALAEAASWFACSAGHISEEPPLHEPPAIWLMDTVDMHAFSPGFYIDVSDYVSLKRKMLACHKSQLGRGGDSSFEPLEQLMLRQSSSRGAQAGVQAAEAFCLHPAWKRIRAW